MVRALLAACLLSGLMATAIPAFARSPEASPVVDILSTVEPSECSVAPRLLTEEAWLELASGPVPPALLVPTPITRGERPPAFPDGVSVHGDQLAEAVAALQPWAACVNVGNSARAVSLFSDDYWRRVLDKFADEPGETREDVAREFAGSMSDAPFEQSPDAVTRSITILAAHELDDGRVAVMTIRSKADHSSDLDIWLLVRVEGRYLIDEWWHKTYEADEPSGATPEP